MEGPCMNIEHLCRGQRIEQNRANKDDKGKKRTKGTEETEDWTFNGFGLPLSNIAMESFAPRSS